MSFGTIFGVPLVNSEVTSYEYPIKYGSKIKVLLISDTHLGATVDPPAALTLFIDSLNNLVRNEKPNCIFILGDLVDGTQSTSYLLSVLEKLTTISTPIYAMGGNHDREFFEEIQWPKGNNVTITNCLSFKLSMNQPGKRNLDIYLAHDLLNNYRVRDPHAYFFASWIKDACSSTIKPEDWLIIGHTHTGFVSHSSKIGCVGQFAPEIGVFGYSTIEFGPDPVFSSKVTLLSKNK